MGYDAPFITQDRDQGLAEFQDTDRDARLAAGARAGTRSSRAADGGAWAVRGRVRDCRHQDVW